MATLSLARVFSAGDVAVLTDKIVPKLGSSVFKWEDLKIKPTPVGERRDVADNLTATFETFESHVSTLNSGMASHLPHTHP